MKPRVSFVVSESMKSVVQSLGINQRGSDLPSCAYMVGDFISFPEARGIYMKVTGRVFLAKPNNDSEWIVLLEKAGDPFAALEQPLPQTGP